jgi:hypothetical protein
MEIFWLKSFFGVEGATTDFGIIDPLNGKGQP